MLKRIIRIIYCIVVFVLTVLIGGRLINREEIDMTGAMADARLPVVTVRTPYGELNTMHGYAREMEIASMRGTILPLDEKRGVDIAVDCFGTGVAGISFEVRTIADNNLVEQTEVPFETGGEDRINASFTIKDLIGRETEHMLVLLLELADGEVFRYYTRVVWPTENGRYHLSEKLAFIRMFHEGTHEGAEEITRYLETNAEGDNASFRYVDIHSNFSRVTFSGLDIRERTSPRICIYDIHDATASVRLEYDLTIRESDRDNLYHVTEDYFVRISSGEMYLIDFNRTLNYLFQAKRHEFSEDRILLSYSDPDTQLRESAGGSTFAFVNEGRLFMYHMTEGRLIRVFAFFDEEHNDVRCTYQGSDVRILDVDEAGNVRFMVTGYMNRGRHEGDVGCVLYHFDAPTNTVEELLYIPDVRSEEIVRRTMEGVNYIGSGNILYTIFGGSVHAVSLNDYTERIVIPDIVYREYALSESGALIASQKKEDGAPAGEISLTDFSTGDQYTVSSDAGERLRLLGFMGEDLIYGVYRIADVRPDEIGNPVYAMYRVCISTADGTLLTEYREDNILVTGISQRDNQIILHRVAPSGDGYREIEDDQIMNAEGAGRGYNRVVQIQRELSMETAIAMRDRMEREELQLLTPGETAFEGERTVTVSYPATGKQYYAYDQREITGIYSDASAAVQSAFAHYGQVTDEKGNYIYYRGNLLQRNQIMALTNQVAGEQFYTRDRTEACLSVVLDYEGMSRDVSGMLRDGQSVTEILAETLPGRNILNLDGCPLNAVLYYVNQDYPVIAKLNDDRCMLVIGFNESQVVVFDPSVNGETVYRLGMGEASRLFQTNGNHFVTYIAE